MNARLKHGGFIFLHAQSSEHLSKNSSIHGYEIPQNIFKIRKNQRSDPFEVTVTEAMHVRP